MRCSILIINSYFLVWRNVIPLLGIAFIENSKTLLSHTWGNLISHNDSLFFPIYLGREHQEIKNRKQKQFSSRLTNLGTMRWVPASRKCSSRIHYLCCRANKKCNRFVKPRIHLPHSRGTCIPSPGRTTNLPVYFHWLLDFLPSCCRTHHDTVLIFFLYSPLPSIMTSDWNPQKVLKLSDFYQIYLSPDTFYLLLKLVTAPLSHIYSHLPY
jgi:hypothetical protein